MNLNMGQQPTSTPLCTNYQVPRWWTYHDIHFFSLPPTRRRRRFSTTDNSTQNVPEGIAINLDVTIADPAKEPRNKKKDRPVFFFFLG